MLFKHNLRYFLLPCGIIAIAIFVQWMDIDIRYSRAGIENGEYWRLVTAHFVHLSWNHMWLNALSLLIIWELAAKSYRFGWIIICGFGMSLGLWLFSPQVIWYVGLSGILHGLLAATAWQRYPILLVLLMVKLVWEQLYGALPATANLTGGTVIVDAHLYGAVIGICLQIITNLSSLNVIKKVMNPP
ncbi:MAG: rhombosortase [Candidatus Parabeggiatoa sp. nov. 3]|nr:MAG: rhombosortase [Gammaproteobacteria bacterium]RKZ56433.1 MAG: rhombosortase [Gammaproteobacteria bacterium]